MKVWYEKQSGGFWLCLVAIITSLLYRDHSILSGCLFDINDSGCFKIWMVLSLLAFIYMILVWR